VYRRDVPEAHGDRNCSLRALSQRTIVFKLTRDDFMDILDTFPNQKALLVKAVKRNYVPPQVDNHGKHDDHAAPLDAIYHKKFLKRTHSNFSINTPLLQGLANKKVSFYLRKSKDGNSSSTSSPSPTQHTAEPTIGAIPAEGRRSSERMHKLEKMIMASSPSRYDSPMAPRASPMNIRLESTSAPESDVGFLTKFVSYRCSSILMI
jgi:hypothetical protein